MRDAGTRDDPLSYRRKSRFASRVGIGVSMSPLCLLVGAPLSWNCSWICSHGIALYGIALECSHGIALMELLDLLSHGIALQGGPITTNHNNASPLPAIKKGIDLLCTLSQPGEACQPPSEKGLT